MQLFCNASLLLCISWGFIIMIQKFKPVCKVLHSPYCTCDVTSYSQFWCFKIIPLFFIKGYLFDHCLGFNFVYVLALKKYFCAVWFPQKTISDLIHFSSHCYSYDSSNALSWFNGQWLQLSCVVAWNICF